MRKPTIGLLFLALVLPAPVASARVVAPPGNSEADQYFETIPGAAGPTTPDTSKTAEDAVREGKLTPAELRALERRGATGAALATAVAQTAPPEVGKSGSGPGSGSAKSVSFEIPGQVGMGVLFPLILIATAALFGVYLVDRRRHPTAR